MDGGVMRGYCDTGSLKMAMAPAMERTMAMTIAKRGRSTKTLEKVFILSISGLRFSFMSICLSVVRRILYIPPGMYVKGGMCENRQSATTCSPGPNTLGAPPDGGITSATVPGGTVNDQTSLPSFS